MAAESITSYCGVPGQCQLKLMHRALGTEAHNAHHATLSNEVKSCAWEGGHTAPLARNRTYRIEFTTGTTIFRST